MGTTLCVGGEEDALYMTKAIGSTLKPWMLEKMFIMPYRCTTPWIAW